MPDRDPVTVPELFAHTVGRVPDKRALGIVCDGALDWLTWREVAEHVEQVAQRFLAAGVRPRDRVVQWAPNSLPWILADLALLSLGAVHVPLHASLSCEQASEQLALADAQLLLVAEHRQAAEVERVFPRSAVPVLLHQQLTDRVASPALPQGSAGPDDLATLLFTSGTTGKPRGVMLIHRNLVSNAVATTQAVGTAADETRLCFLPLSHIYARTCDLYTWIVRGSTLVLAESRETILSDCQLARPTVINGVPYFYQKVAEGLQSAGKSAEPGSLLQLLGGSVRRCFCGGASVPPAVEQLFADQGLPILSGYGLTEAGPVVTATRLEDYAPGTVGRCVPGVEVLLGEQREILVRGPNVMAGYWQDDDATHETLSGGWLRTGDCGEFDSQGRLRILGRLKEWIVLSTGKNVSPGMIESRLAGSPLVESVCVVGEGQKCLAALVVPNPVALRQFIRSERLWVWSRRRAVTHPRVRARYREEFDRLLADLSRHEQIGPFVILDRAFSLQQGEVTTKHSLCRERVANNFREVIHAMYEDVAGD